MTTSHSSRTILFRTIAWAVPLWVLCTTSTACGPKCDPDAFMSQWDAATPATADETRSLLYATCSDAVVTLEPLLEGSDAPAFTALIGCPQDKPILGSLSDLSVRKTLWTTCNLADRGLAKEGAFVWASGRPGLAFAMAHALSEHDASSETTQAIVKRVMGPSVFPADTSPAQLFSGAKPTTQPAVSALGEKETRVILSATHTPGDIVKALQEQSPLTVVALNGTGTGFAEAEFGLATDSAITAPETLSIWIHPGMGASVFNGAEAITAKGECKGYTLCADTVTADALKGVIPTSAAKNGVRIGWVEKVPTLQTAMTALGAVNAQWSDAEFAIQWVGAASVADVNPAQDDVARWIAGLPPLHATIPKKLWQNKYWQRHAASTTKAWGRYAKRHLAEIEAWLPDTYGKHDDRTLFYPFSGPDIVNAVTFFPGSTRYILAGLEDIGAIPQAPKNLGAANQKGLNSFRSSLNNHIARNYFITREMLGMWEKDAMGTHQYNGITAVMMVFLAHTDHEIIGVRKVTLSDKGVLTDAAKLPGKPRALEVQFRKRSTFTPTPHPVKTAIFFQGNLKDSIFHQIRGLTPFLESLGQYNTFLKAASYLMHNRSFDDMRSAVLSRTKHLITDASGVPYHDLAKHPDTWAVELHGSYQAAISDFYPRCQPDLKKDIAAKSKGPLPFRFGYQGKNYHLMLATRLTPIEPISLDKSNDYGTDTFFRGDGEACLKGQQVIDRKTP